MLADSSVQQPQSDGIPCPSWKEYPQPSRENIDWFTNAVWPDLKQIVGVNLWWAGSFLYDAAETLPASERAAWLDLVRRLEIMVGKELGCGHPDQSFFPRLFREFWYGFRQRSRSPDVRLLGNVFRKLLDGLNTNWFIPRGLLLYPRIELPTVLNPKIYLGESLSVRLARLIGTTAFPFADGVLDVYIVEHLLPLDVPLAKRPCYFDPLTRMVVIDQAATRALVREVKLKARGDDLLDEYLFLTGRWDRVFLPIERRFCQWIDSRYPILNDFDWHYRRRSLVEELRHALDGARAGCSAESDEYNWRLVEALLAKGGRVRRLIWQPAQERGIEGLLRGQQRRLEGVLTELSAQLTAAAATDPAMILLEWWRHLALLAAGSGDPWWTRYALSREPEHISAAILGTVLLGEQLGIGPSLSWSMLCEPDFPALADLGWQLAKRPATELRLALKAVYQDEFNYPIDELPFAEILADGELRSRFRD